jgi:hypothetical protein
MKLYKVKASYITYLSIDIEANSAEQAREIAKDMDGGDFNIDCYSDWSIDDVDFQCNAIYSNEVTQ